MTRERRLYATALLLLLVATGIAVGFQPEQTDPALPAAATGNFDTTADGVRYTVDPDRLQQGCPGGLDCIHTIDDPRFQSAEDAD